MVGDVKPPSATPDTKATQVELEQFVERATRAALRVVEEQGAGGRVVGLDLQPLAPEVSTAPGVRIFIGILLK